MLVSLRRYDLVSGSKGIFSVRLGRTTPNEFGIIFNERLRAIYSISQQRASGKSQCFDPFVVFLGHFVKIW